MRLCIFYWPEPKYPGNLHNPSASVMAFEESEDGLSRDPEQKMSRKSQMGSGTYFFSFTVRKP